MEKDSFQRVAEQLRVRLSEIRTSQTFLTSAAMFLIWQLHDQKKIEARLTRLEEEMRQLKQQH